MSGLQNGAPTHSWATSVQFNCSVLLQILPLRELKLQSVTALGKDELTSSHPRVRDKHQKCFWGLLWPSRRGRTCENIQTLKVRATHSSRTEACRLAHSESQRIPQWCSPALRACYNMSLASGWWDILRLWAEHIQIFKPSALLRGKLHEEGSFLKFTHWAEHYLGPLLGDLGELTFPFWASVSGSLIFAMD